MADNLQTAIDYLNNSVKLLPNNPFKMELTKNSSNDDKFMALCYVMQQTYGLSLTGQMDTPTIRRLEKEGDNISILNGGEYDINRFVGIALTMLGYDIGDPLSKYTSGAVREAVNSHVSKLGAYADMTLWGMPKGHLIAILAGEQAELNSTIGSKNVQNAQRDINHIITNDGEFARLVATDGVFKPYMLHSLTQCLYSVTGIPKENDDFDTVINPAKLISAGYSEFDRRKMWYKLHDLLISALELADVFPMELTSDTDSLYLTDPDIEVGIKAFGTKYNATGYTITDDNVILSLRYVYSLFTHKVMKDNEFVKVPFKIEDGYEIENDSDLSFSYSAKNNVIQAFTPTTDATKNPPLILFNSQNKQANDTNRIYETAYRDDALFIDNLNNPKILLQNDAGGHTQSLFYADKSNHDKLFVGTGFKQMSNTNWAQNVGLINNQTSIYNDSNQFSILNNFGAENYRIEFCADFYSNPTQFWVIKTILSSGDTQFTCYNFTSILNALSNSKLVNIQKFKPLKQYTITHLSKILGSLQGFSKLPNKNAMLISTGFGPERIYENNVLKNERGNYGFYLLPLTDTTIAHDAILVNVVSDDQVNQDIIKYMKQLPHLASYTFQTEVEAINAIDDHSAYLILSTHILDPVSLTLKLKSDLNVLYKVSW